MQIEILSTRSIHTQKYDLEKKTFKKKVTEKLSLAEHGFATDPQQYSYLGLGSILWVTIMLLGRPFFSWKPTSCFSANVASLERSKGVTTFLTTTCNRNYKECVRMATMDFCGHLMRECYETKSFTLPQPVSKIRQVKGAPLEFSKDDNEANLRLCQKKNFYDQKTCRHLCSNTIILESTTTIAVSPCESMCFGLTKTSQSGEQICPTQNLCPTGCPCQGLKIQLQVRLKKE